MLRFRCAAARRAGLRATHFLRSAFIIFLIDMTQFGAWIQPLPGRLRRLDNSLPVRARLRRKPLSVRKPLVHSPGNHSRHKQQTEDSQKVSALSANGSRACLVGGEPTCFSYSARQLDVSASSGFSATGETLGLVRAGGRLAWAAHRLLGKGCRLV